MHKFFFNDARNQILNALDEIDNLIAYWRDQQYHQLGYFFHKSPTKWVMGKTQTKEIGNNIKKLERKQRELYTILGSLTGHVHAFTESGVGHDDCYAWIEELFEVLSCVRVPLQYHSDGTRFDDIAAALALKIKRVGLLKHDLLLSIVSTRKPNHFVRHWIAYTAVLAAAGYAAHYYSHNYTNVNSLFDARFSSLRKNWVALVVRPSEGIWETFFGKVDDSINQDSSAQFEKGISDFAKNIKDLEIKQHVNKETSNKLNSYLKADHEITQKSMKKLLNKFVEDKKSFIKKDETKKDVTYYLTQDDVQKIIAAEIDGDETGFQQLVYDMPKHLVGDLVLSDDFLNAVLVIAELKIYHYGSSLVQVVFELIVDHGIPVVKEALIVLSKGNKEWAAAYKKVNLILNAAVLTPTIIVGGAGCRGLYKTYQWATKKNYSPIRIALADVNSLLIESHVQLDDHDYGKLVYLICKLRHKTAFLKDPLSHEFLDDVARLESKQYTPAIKRGIVDNMFNKYAFLGRIAG